MTSLSGSSASGSMVQVDEERIRGHVDEVVRPRASAFASTLKTRGAGAM